MSTNDLSLGQGLAPVPGGVNQPQSKFKPVDPVRLIRQHLILLFMTGIVGVVAGVGTWYVLKKVHPVWASSAQLRVTGGVEDLEQLSTGLVFQGNMEPIEFFIKSEIYNIQSEAILTDTLKRPEVRNSQWYADYKDDFNRAREELAEDHLRVSMLRNTQLINIQATTQYEEDCQKIVNALLEVYLGRMRSATTEQVSSRRQTLVSERSRYQDTIRQLTDQISEFALEHDLTNLDTRLEEAALATTMLVEARGEKSFELTAYEKAYDSAQQKRDAGGGPSPEDILRASGEEPIALRDERLRSLREQREVVLHDFGVEHRMVKAIDRQIAAVEGERDREVERILREQEEAMINGYKSAIEGAKEEIADFETQIDELRQKLIDLNQYQTKYDNLTVQLERAEGNNDLIEAQLSKVRVTEGLPEAVPVQLQTRATLPELVFPEFIIIVPAVTIGLLGLVAGAVFLRELMDQSIKSPADVKLLREAELLGTIPHVQEDPSGPDTADRVVEKYPTGLLAEAYRQVRTSLLGKMDRRGYKTLLLASAQSGSGASSVTYNLAASLAFNGRKVVIIDANFRRPAQHNFVDADNDRGLVDVLLYGASLDDMLFTIHDPDIALLPTGRAGDAPPELLEGPKFRALLADLETRFDIVLIDAPPALLSSECQVLSKMVDAMAVVVRASADKRGMIDRMVGQFTGQRADMLGLILSGVQSNIGGYFRASFRDFHRYRENGQTNGKSNGRSRRQPVEQTETLEVD
jgi:polysaccharide biosynthesis transport protein